MNCETAQDQLGSYIDGTLAPETRAALDVHLAMCPGCAKELEAITEMVSALAPQSPTHVPTDLWSSIEARLDRGEDALSTQAAAGFSPRDVSKTSRDTASSKKRAPSIPARILRRPPAMAASLLLAVGAGFLASLWAGGGSTQASAAPVDFGVLLDALPLDPNRAFQRFLTLYGAKRVTPVQARQYASGLSFDLPEALPGGFHLKEVFSLRFGEHAGIAVRYSSNGEFLGAIFHPPVQREHFGMHKDYPCVIGKHRGHQVAVGEWKLVHLTDPTTCHCILSRLDENTELPAVLARIAPAMFEHHGHDHGHDHTAGE